MNQSREHHDLAALHEPFALLGLQHHLAVEDDQHLLGRVMEVVHEEVARPELVDRGTELLGVGQPLRFRAASRPVLALVPFVRPDVVVAHVGILLATARRGDRSNETMEAGHAVSSRLGRITISSEAIAQIVAETALECYGVVGMKGSLRGQLARARGRPRGIEIRREGAEMTVDLHVVVEYGLNLAEVASSVSNRVAYEVRRLTGLRVRAVEVHVDDVRTGGK